MRSIRQAILRKRLDGADFAPAGFFVLRTPLLPVEELAGWGALLRAPHAVGDITALAAAIDADRRELREWLHSLLARPAILEALHVASPHLVEGLEEWHRDPESKKGRRAEEALVRYVMRMTSRATPFGLFAGCTTGRVGEHSRLRIGEQRSYRRHSRLDVDFLFTLADDLNHDRDLRRSLTYRPNTSLYRAAGRLRYAEARFNGEMLDYHLVAVEPNDFLDAALVRAGGGATLGEIVAAVTASDPDGEVSVEDAEGFVEELIDGQLLVSELWPAMTGPEAVHGLIGTLERTGHDTAAVLRRTQEALDVLDLHELGNAPARYQEIARGLEPLPKRADARRLYQVDLSKPGDAVLTPAVLDEISHAVEVLHRLSRPDPTDWLEGFRDRFLERYGAGRLVQLVEALDDEAGIGLPASKVGIDASPLLKGIDFPADADVKLAWGKREELLLRKMTDVLAAGGREIEITDDDLASLESGKRPPLPNSFQATVTIAARSEEALDSGELRVFLRNVFGPSGARMVGRFCHADDALTGLVLDHLRAEEALDPDVIFAEIVHMPAGRIGNIASRPLLRQWEIPFLGVSGAPRENQIAIDDLRVTVELGEVTLYSARLGRRVMPRLTSAHNFTFGSLAVYRFLCSLQQQGVRAGLGWSWEQFQRLPFLPRIRSGRAVLSRACWRIDQEEIAKLTALRGAERYLAVRRWREERRAPRMVVFVEMDHELLVDFDNILSLDAFLSAIHGRDEALLNEVWPEFDDLPVYGPEGRFVHELVVPFERRREPARRPKAPAAQDEVDRILPPNSRWLYLKLYTGAATADLVLRDVVAPLVARALGAGDADQWFFLRYGDPQWHLRVRFGGEPERLRGLIGMLGEHLDPALREGRIWRWQLDTYEREIERYGGPAGLEIAERIFHADSEAALAALADLAGDQGADARWRLTVVGIDRLFEDFGLDLAARREALSAMRGGFAGEFEVGPDLNRQLGRRLREVGDDLYKLLTSGVDDEHPLAGGFAALARRSETLAPLIAQLHALESRGELSVRVVDLVWNYVHMFVNRMIRSDQRAHELVLYDLLHKLTLSRLKRSEDARAEPRSQAPDPTPALAG
ncbi:MAG TPA: lantibiotic dehydratase [Thermoanaerobaculia bacterium]|jgi:thiopeptide-type bacteriocin biosynthesis protein|nr:lantibiotic dehydratase [Thermoanaerobaculia bacterium]